MFGENRAIIAEYLGVEPDRISCGNQVLWFKSCGNYRRARWCGAFGRIQLSMIVMRYLQTYPMYRYFYLPPIV